MADIAWSESLDRVESMGCSKVATTEEKTQLIGGRSQLGSDLQDGYRKIDLISRRLSDAQIQRISGREDWKSVSILTGRCRTGVSGGPPECQHFKRYPTMPETTIL